MNTLTNLTIDKALDGLKNKEFTSVELTQAHIDMMEKHNNLYVKYETLIFGCNYLFHL